MRSLLYLGIARGVHTAARALGQPVVACPEDGCSDRDHVVLLTRELRVRPLEDGLRATRAALSQLDPLKGRTAHVPIQTEECRFSYAPRAEPVATAIEGRKNDERLPTAHRAGGGRRRGDG